LGFTTLGLSAALITFSKGCRASLRLAPPPRALPFRRQGPGGCRSQVSCVTVPCCLLSSCPCCCCWFGDWTRAQVASPLPLPLSRPFLSPPPSLCPPEASWRPGCRGRTADSTRGGDAGCGHGNGLRTAPGKGSRSAAGSLHADTAAPSPEVLGRSRRDTSGWRCLAWGCGGEGEGRTYRVPAAQDPRARRPGGLAARPAPPR
jgi:hypothetical protein